MHLKRHPCASYTRAPRILFKIMLIILNLAKESETYGYALLRPNSGPDCYLCRSLISRRTIIVNRAPDTIQPLMQSIMEPSMMQTSMIQPSLMQPSMMQSSLMQPSMMQPSMTQRDERSLLMELSNEEMLATDLTREENSIIKRREPKKYRGHLHGNRDEGFKDLEESKALVCANLPCHSHDAAGPVCACNFKTGNVVTFRNKCDLKRHNCRFDTEFKKILDDICPWEFESRSGLPPQEVDYNKATYYNH